MIKRKAAESIFKCNSNSYNIKKAYEELIELSLELIQFINKPDRKNNKAIISEIADVKIRLWFLEQHFGKKKINTAITQKLKKLSKNVSNR